MKKLLPIEGFLYILLFLIPISKWKRLSAGTVPVNKKHLKCTVPANKEHLTGTVPVNKEHLKGTLKKYPNTPKYPLVRPKKCQSFVQRLRGTLFPEGNQLSVNWVL